MPAGSSVTVSADLWYAIEANYDYLYAEYSTDGGATWTQVGQPLTGSGTKWASKKWSYRPADSTRPTLFQFRYATDGGVNEAGAFLDNISVKVGQTSVLSDGAEAGDNGWTVKGWKVSTGTEVTNAERYYLLENRQYVGYDQTLQRARTSSARRTRVRTGSSTSSSRTACSSGWSTRGTRTTT